MLFLDEPSRGLDPLSARDIRQTIQELCQQGTTVLLTTHLMEEADQLCQHVAFIVGGHIVANDTPQNLKLNYGHRVMSVTLGGDTEQHGTLDEMTLDMDNPNDQAQFAQLMAQGKVRAVHSQETTLEEVFIEVAGVRPA
jgi:ABC-2 type transport system ATP-binding protein